jgi:hypothetical protein
MSTHTPAEWAEMVALAFGIWGTGSVFYFLAVDADLADFDPRPAARRALAALHQGAVHAGHDLNRARAHAERAAVHAAITTAAAVALLLPAHGGTR